MCCILCYNGLVSVLNPRLQAMKGLISYYKINGMTHVRKHVDVVSPKRKGQNNNFDSSNEFTLSEYE
jgi:hypothetical protein